MGESSIARATLSCLVAVLMVVGFTAAPAAAVDDGVSVSDDGVSVGVDGNGVEVNDDGDVTVENDTSTVEESIPSEEDTPDEGTLPDEEDIAPDDSNDDEEGPFPDAVCTDVGDQAQENVPFEQVPWFDDLPEQAQPPGVPTNLITPEVAAAIVFGATPNQCEVQDPNDPSVDPTDPPRDPDYSVENQRMGQFRDGAVGVVVFDVTANESGEGPGATVTAAGLATSQFGDADPSVTVNDGEKDYTVDPRVRYFDDGTGMAETNVELLGTRLGVVMDCNGEECQPGTRGLPELQKPPAIPAPTSQEGDDSEGPFPSAVCTDVGNQAQENVPFEQVPWFDDLPEQAQPPGVPTNLITPEVAAAIVFGATPNQCEVQDPNDPSVDPQNPPSDPGASATPSRYGQYRDGAVGLVFYEVTANESGEGPGVSGKVGGLATSEFGDADAELTVNDGEKDYTVDPRLRYHDGGSTAMAETNVELLGTRLGVVMDCNGEECQPGTRGLPELQELPAIPAPTGE